MENISDLIFYGSLGWPPKFQHWFWDLDIESFVCMTSALDGMVKTKYLPPKAKSHIWNPKSKVEIEVAILGFHNIFTFVCQNEQVLAEKI